MDHDILHVTRPEGFDFPKPVSAATLIENQVVAAQFEERRRRAARHAATRWVLIATGICYVVVFTPVAIVIALVH